MKQVNPYGRSFTEPGGKRKLKKRKPSNPNDETAEFSNFLPNDPNAIIAAYISVIDKIYRKPKSCHKGEEPYKRRDALGRACWPLVVNRLRGCSHGADEDEDRWQKIWSWKLHPYLEKPNGRRKPDDGFKPEGRWHGTFLRRGRTSAEDLEAAAKAIDDHLFSRARRLAREGEKCAPSNDEASRAAGLIAQRANAIEQSLPLERTEVLPLPWTETDKALYRARFDPAPMIALTAEAFERNAMLGRDHKDRQLPARLRASDAGAILFHGYEGLFRDEQGHRPEKKQLAASDHPLHGLYALHEAIREYYKRTIKTSQKGRKDPQTKENREALSSFLPATTEQLFDLLEKRQENKDTNRMIRLGRLLYYAGYRGGELKEPARAKLDYYKTSAGQAEIKRSEAFVRVWRSTVSQGARTLRALVGAHTFHAINAAAAKPAQEVRDVTEAKLLERLPAHFDPRHSAEKLKLLFGAEAGNFPSPDRDAEQLRELVEGTIRMLSRCRHGVFHFNNRADFVASLKSAVESSAAAGDDDFEDDEEGRSRDKSLNLPDHVLKTFGALLKTDRVDRKRRIRRNLQAVHLPAFASPGQIQALCDALYQDSSSDLVLPKFHSLLGQAENTRLSSASKLRLPPKPNAQALKDKATLCRYSLLKYLYQGPFRHHLDIEVSQERIESCYQRVLDSGTDRAKAINGRKPHGDLIQSKAAKLSPPNRASLWRYFHELDGEAASILRVTKGYESDKGAAREKANFVVAFQREFTALLFLEYLKEKEFDWLTGDLREQTPSELPEAPRDDIEFEPWEASLYFVLHLIPADDLSLLLHQFRKWRALSAEPKAGSSRENRAAAFGDADRLRDLLTLCIDMQNDKLDGQDMGLDVAAVKDLFEDRGDFERVFPPRDPDLEENDSALRSSQRGLREILRFGHLEVLIDIYAGSKIPHRDVVAFLEGEGGRKGQLSPVARAQARRMDLHHAAVTDPQKFSQEDLEQYRRLTAEISRHRLLTAKVRLLNFTRAHAILIRVLGRLIDFCGLWERDIYFLTLALLHRREMTIEDACDLAGKEVAFAAYTPDLESYSSDVNKDLKRTRGNAKTTVKAFTEREQLRLAGLTSSFIGRLAEYSPDVDNEAVRSYRNDLAHFNLLDNDDPVNLTEQVNRVRRLMKYDRKLKNAVSKSIMDLLEREKLKLRWSMDREHQLIRPAVLSTPIEHLQKVRTKFRTESEPAEWTGPRNRRRRKTVGDLLKDKKIAEPAVTPELRAIVLALFSGVSGSERS